MHGRALSMVGLLVLVGGLGIVGASADAKFCEPVAGLPEPVPVVALPDGGEATLLAPLDPAALLAGDLDTHACGDKIRPGARVIINNSYRCSLNWIYTDNFGNLYVGTAGHCAPNYAPRVYAAAGVTDIGDTAFTTGNGGVGNDFALIKIDPAYHHLVDPTMCHWGGPQYVAAPGSPEAVMHYGWGQDFQTTSATRARAGVIAPGGWGANSITFLGMVAGGDSGSPLMVWDAEGGAGGAAGVITHTTYLFPPHTGPQYANRIDSGLNRANLAQPGMGYRLVPSLLAPDPTGLTIPE